MGKKSTAQALKKVHKPDAGDSKVEKVEPVALKEEPSAKPDEDFWADSRRNECLELMLGGANKSQVAKHLKVHRNTIGNWCSDPRFVAEANQRMREHVAAKRIQRAKGTNIISDKVQRITVAIASKIEDTLLTKDGELKDLSEKDEQLLGRRIRTFREMGYEFREFREQERKDTGDDVKRVSINSQHSITGDIAVTHSGINETPFAEYMRKALDDGAIDAEVIEREGGTRDGQLLLKAAEHVLVDTDLLDQINAEDEAEEAAKRQ